MSNCDEMLDSAWDELCGALSDLDISYKWAKRWKALAKRQRKQVAALLPELDQALARLESVVDRLRNNPGLALASLVMEAAQEGQEIGNRAAECMGWAFANYLSNHPEAPNYLEVTLTGQSTDPIYVTVHRPGGKTPHQFRMEAEAERDRLRAELEALKISIGASDCATVFCEDPHCSKNNPRT